jgi:hypothetical protein
MKLNLFLLTLLVALVAANFGVSDNPNHRNWEAMPEMVRTVAYKSFSANPNFADGKTLQLPPEGAIARPQAHEFTRPGAVVYQIYCQPCPGGAGKGDGPVAMRGFPPPPSLLADHAYKRGTATWIKSIVPTNRSFGGNHFLLNGLPFPVERTSLADQRLY